MSRDTTRLTTAQALIRFLSAQHVERDGTTQPFFAGCFGIFGHGNVAGIGQALQEAGDLRFYPARNEQAMVHTAAAFARQRDRLATFVCTSSIGPGATNMVTAAAGATINRLPVLLLPGDLFATRRQRPVLQQLEDPRSQDVSVNDALRPVSRYWDRLNRPEQLITAAPEAMRVLTDPAETGAVTLCLPQDVQAEAFDFPTRLLERRVWHVPRPRPDEAALDRAVTQLRGADRPLIVAGGGVVYAGATGALRTLVDATGIPVTQTQAGKGALPYDHPANLGAAGVTGTPGANEAARQADVVLGVGTRWTDFTTASGTAFANPDVRFINVNVAAFDAGKLSGLALTGDARVTLEALADRLEGTAVSADYRAWAEQQSEAWDATVTEAYHPDPDGTGPTRQTAVIGAVNAAAEPGDVVVCASGSMPGQLHRLWRTRDPHGYHVEYGYSCMGYEIAGGLGVKLADPDREVFVLVGDGAYLMMSSAIVTSIQEGCKLTIVLLDNRGFASIGGLSRSIGSGGFGTAYRFRDDAGALEGGALPVDLAANARSFGARVFEAGSAAEVADALQAARSEPRTTLIAVETDIETTAPGGDAWWDVPVAAASRNGGVRAARRDYERALTQVRTHL